MIDEFKEYGVSQPPDDDSWFPDECAPFDHVTHVAHIGPALAILEDRILRARLVYDESILNTDRSLVVWLSPNHWGTGYRYGTVRFSFPFDQLVTHKNLYCVEVIAYKIPACRILITSKDHPELTPYDPAVREGPWWRDPSTGQNYFNNKICLELLIEDDLALSTATEMDFVDHHGSWCSMHRNGPTECPELGMSDMEASALALGRLVGRGVSVPANLLGAGVVAELPSPLDRAYTNLLLQLHPLAVNEGICTGTIGSGDPEAPALIRAVCNAYGLRKKEEMGELIKLFDSKESLTTSLHALVSGLVE